MTRPDAAADECRLLAASVRRVRLNGSVAEHPETHLIGADIVRGPAVTDFLDLAVVCVQPEGGEVAQMLKWATPSLLLKHVGNAPEMFVASLRSRSLGHATSTSSPMELRPNP